MIRQDCAGIGRGKKLAEPLEISSRGSSHLPSQVGDRAASDSKPCESTLQMYGRSLGLQYLKVAQI